MTDFINIDILLTLAGCVTLTTLFTEMCKLYIKKSIDPKWYSLAFSFVFVTARQIFIVKDHTMTGWFMTGINIVVCLLSAVGIFETVGKVLEQVIISKLNSDQ